MYYSLCLQEANCKIKVCVQDVYKGVFWDPYLCRRRESRTFREGSLATVLTQQPLHTPQGAPRMVQLIRLSLWPTGPPFISPPQPLVPSLVCYPEKDMAMDSVILQLRPSLKGVTTEDVC